MQKLELNNCPGILLIIFLLFSFTNCKKTKEKLILEDVSRKDIRIDTLQINSFYLEDDIFTSCVGKLGIFDSKLYFADKLFSTIYLYDKNGNFIEKKLTKGKGPKEIYGLHYALKTDNGFFILDGSYNTFFFSNDWNKQFANRVSFNRKRNIKHLRRNANPKYAGIYEIGYFTDEIRQIDSSHALIPVNTAHPKLNAYFSGCETFYNECYILGFLNMTTGRIDSMIGRRPPIYLEKENIPNFRFVHYDVNENDIYITYEADSSIYLYNMHKGYQYKFGYKGLNMNTNYKTTKDFKTAEKNYYSDRNKYGYYHYLEYTEETGLLFRGYKKGNHTQNNGLQVYKKNTIIADFKVPKDFKVIGYIKPYYYAQGTLDEINEKIQVYRFKLPNNT